MPDSQEYRRSLASGQNTAATTQEYKMAQDRERILKALNEKWKDRDDLSDEQIANSIQRDNPDLSMDVITKTVSTNRPKKPSDTRNLSDKGYPSTLYDADMKKPDTRNLSEKGYPSTLYDANMKKPDTRNLSDKGYPSTINDADMKKTQDREQILKDIGWDDVDLSNPVENAPASNQPTGNANTQSNTQAHTKTQNTTSQQTPTPDAMAGHYSRDPNQATKQPNEEKEDEEAKPKEKKRWNFSPEFFGDLFKNRNPNNVLYDRRDMMRGLADEATNMAATLGMQGQSWRQEANRNPYSEASKKASATNAQQMAANIAANSATGQNQVGLVRMNNPMDINAEEQKRAESRRLADERQEKQRTTEGQARAYLGEAQQLNTRAKKLASDMAESRRLSLGEGGGVSTSTEKDETKKTDETAEENPETTTETTTEENQPEPQLTEAEVHQILNYVTYGNDPTSPQNHFDKLNDAQKSLWQSWGSPQPLTEEEASKYTGIPADGKGKGFGTNAQLGVMQTAVRELRPEYWEKQKQAESERKLDTPEQNNSMTQDQLKGMKTQVQTYACGTKNAKPGYAIVGEEGPEIVKMNGGEEVIPNEWAERIISDERMKFIKTCFDMGLGISPEDFEWLAKKQGGKFNFNDREYDFFNDDDWTDDTDDSVLNGYANHIKNYLYTYIPEAQEIDESIDPNQEHIGPMAQDIEKVNPACIVETPEGVKTVDTGRLAMMNAGAIGDLARQLRELKEVFING